ncbi:MAG TPA: hypothetical protein VKA84_01635 [Gemmatimonadaceae bacterium]|nr:hypothetical protein [Gemmatimonadaceae bacterium]
MSQAHYPSLGRSLIDPETGLPNLPYYDLIRDWEERRARRRDYCVREVTVEVIGGADRLRQALAWQLRAELRDSDLIASNGRGHFEILLTSPDAEHAERLRERLRQVTEKINAPYPPWEQVTMRVTVD